MGDVCHRKVFFDDMNAKRNFGILEFGSSEDRNSEHIGTSRRRSFAISESGPSELWKFQRYLCACVVCCVA